MRFDSLPRLFALAVGVAFVLTACVVPVQDSSTPKVSVNRDAETCAAMFDTTEEELGLTSGTDVAVGQRNYANWLEGMFGDADDPMLRSYALAAAGAARVTADTFEKVGELVSADGEVLVTALLNLQNRCKQIMGIAP